MELSYLKPEEQKLLLDSMNKQQSTPSRSQALRMKKFSQEGRLSRDVMDAIMSEEKKPDKEAVLSSQNNTSFMEDGFIKLPIDRFLTYLPKSLIQDPSPESQEKLTTLFLKMAELYKRYLTRKRAQER